jgi:ubiquitin C-terminal hydrolase
MKKEQIIGTLMPSEPEIDTADSTTELFKSKIDKFVGGKKESAFIIKSQQIWLTHKQQASINIAFYEMLIRMSKESAKFSMLQPPTKVFFDNSYKLQWFKIVHFRLSRSLLPPLQQSGIIKENFSVVPYTYTGADILLYAHAMGYDSLEIDRYLTECRVLWRQFRKRQLRKWEQAVLKEKFWQHREEEKKFAHIQKCKFLHFNEDFYDFGNRLDAGHILQKSLIQSMVYYKGITRMNVSCYMNAALQTLLHIPAVVNYLYDVSVNSHPDFPYGSLTRDLAHFLYFLTEPVSQAPLYPTSLIMKLQDIESQFEIDKQEDSHEFLMYLISKMQYETTPKGASPKKSIIHTLFGGTFEQSITCNNCGNVSTTEQDFYDILLSLDKEDSLNKPLQTFKDYNFFDSKKTPTNYYDKEILDKTNLAWYLKRFFNPTVIEYLCPRCPKSGVYTNRKQPAHSATSSLRIKEAPEHLILAAMRFKKTSRGNLIKLKTNVSFPANLDIEEFIIPHFDASEHSGESMPYLYSLNSVVAHFGNTIHHGHFQSYCRQHDGSWALFDDDNVVCTTLNDVINNQKDKVYYLVYNRLTVTRRPQSMRVKRVDICGRGETACKRVCHSEFNQHEQIYHPKYEDKFFVSERRIKPDSFIKFSAPTWAFSPEDTENLENLKFNTCLNEMRPVVPITRKPPAAVVRFSSVRIEPQTLDSTIFTLRATVPIKKSVTRTPLYSPLFNEQENSGRLDYQQLMGCSKATQSGSFKRTFPNQYLSSRTTTQEYTNNIFPIDTPISQNILLDEVSLVRDFMYTRSRASSSSSTKRRGRQWFKLLPKEVKRIFDHSF